nr:PREDICTED: gustatory receptor for bitter taste 93a-like [Tribolium castaneum]|eukprot:XP_015835365.1 PREDICTED: gustatory receptor for bitter taste 93a-like [Tribolium castaneum]
MVTKMVCQFSRNNDLLRNSVSKPLFWYLIVQVAITGNKILGAVLTISPDAEVYLNVLFYNFAELFSYNINILIFFYLIIFQNAYTSYFKAITRKNTYNDPKIVVQIFYKFYEISNNINETLQVPILLRIFTDFVFTISSMFYLSVFLYIIPELSFFVLAKMVLWLVNTLFAIFIMAYFFDQMTEKRNTIMETLEDLPSSHTLISKFHSSYKRKELLRLRLKHERFCFNVCGFFPLNNSFIYLMIAGIVTYTTYLVQFGKAANAKQ